MENKDISQIALQRIKESGIKPISKNIFNLKRVIFWSLVGVSIIIGAISFSVTLSLLFNNDWDLYNKYGFNFILRTLPYFWVVCLLLFTILGEFYYRKTFFGYRHKVVTIIGVYIILTIIIGSILHLFRIGEIIEGSISENISIYSVLTFDKNELWSHPEEGLISGKIISITGNLINIVDFNNVTWNINIDNAIIGKKVKIKEGETIKILGDIDGDNIFTAEEIRPWVGSKLIKK
ncbi:MAG TPA: hypothetical protein VIK86_00445 [Candidatus Paceibacterota bacterium]